VWESKVPGMDNETQGINRLFAPVGKSLSTLTNLASPHIAGLIIKMLGGGETGALQVAGFYFASYLSCQLVCELVKTLSRRFRPVVTLQAQLKGVKRELPQYQWIFVQGHAAGSSLPSADVAGASMFSTMVYIMALEAGQLTPTVTSYCMWITGIAFFMRGYFQAHHVGDLLSGLAIGAVSMVAMRQLFGPFHQFSYGSASLVQAVVITCWAMVQKLKPKEHKSILTWRNLVQGSTTSAKRMIRRLSSSMSEVEVSTAVKAKSE
jgi:membrane-associated phospholipid phosphatase